MGIKNFLKELKKVDPTIETEITISQMRGKRVAVDTNLWLYQLITAVRKGCGEDLLDSEGNSISHLFGLILRIAFLMRNSIQPVFVLDGKPSEMKRNTLEKRKSIKMKAIKELETPLSDKRKKQMLQRSAFVTNAMIGDCKELFNLMGVPYIQSLEEADTQCSYLYKNNLVDYIISNDSDTIAFGGNAMIKNFKVKGKYLLVQSNWEQRKLAELATLLGNDYCESIKGIGPKKAMEGVDIGMEVFLQEMKVNEDVIEYRKQIVEYYISAPVKKVKILKWKKPNISKLEKYIDKIGMTRNKARIIDSAKQV